MSAGLEVNLVARVEDFELTARLVAPAGSITAIVGPNGSGKTLLTRSIAGFVPCEGEVLLAGRTLTDSSRGITVHPSSRGIGLVTQERTLFETMDVVDNVAFGLVARGVRRRAARERARVLMEELGIAHLGDHRSDKLSGGQAQSVAMARALAVEPDLFLLDEPFSALDPRVRPEIRRRLAHWVERSGTTTLVVTHDPIDALTLANHIVVLDGGRVAQSGSLQEVTARPKSAHVAALLGTNLLRGTASGHEVLLDPDGTDPGDQAQAGTDSVGSVPVAGPSGPGGMSLRLHIAENFDGPVFVLLPPTAVTLSLTQSSTSARNCLQGVVTHLEQVGERVRVSVALGRDRPGSSPAGDSTTVGGADDGAAPPVKPVTIVAEVTPIAVAELGLIEGQSVWASIKATEVTAYER